MQSPITQALEALRRRMPHAREALFLLVLDEIRQLAHLKLARERPGHGLQTTVIVDDAYVRLLGGLGEVSFEDRYHFFGAAAEAIRRILIDNARSMSAAKRGGRMDRGRGARIDLESLPAPETEVEHWEALHEALARLEAKDPRAAEVVRLRFFAGLSEAKTADVLGVTDRTVLRDWVYAKAWLAAELATIQSQGAKS